MDKKVVNAKKPSALGKLGNLLMIPEVGVLVPILILCVVTTILKLVPVLPSIRVILAIFALRFCIFQMVVVFNAFQLKYADDFQIC